MFNWKELIESKREELAAALLRQWENSLDERPGDSLRQHAVEIHKDGTIFEYVVEEHHTSKNILIGDSVLVYQFAGSRNESQIDEYYNGDTQAWIQDMKSFHEIDTDEIIDALIKYKG